MLLRAWKDSVNFSVDRVGRALLACCKLMTALRPINIGVDEIRKGYAELYAPLRLLEQESHQGLLLVQGRIGTARDISSQVFPGRAALAPPKARKALLP